MTQPLHGLLVLWVALPPFAVLWQQAEGQVLFVLYRQPKLAAIAFLGWLLLALFAWRHLWRREPLAVTGPGGLPHPLHVTRSWPGASWLLAFLVYMALTGLWVQVPSNYRYELRQYVLLGTLTLCLGLWLRRDSRARRLVLRAMTLSLALVAVIGCLQAWVPIPWLSPINPDIGAVHPSFMGYKNPMALALLGQIFLVVQQATAGPYKVFWRLVLVMELAYLATLGSRTSYAALALAGLYWGLLMAHRAWREGEPEWRRWGMAGLTVTVVLVGAFSLHPVARQKIASVQEYVTAPARYLDSDRGIYLRNTVHMARHHPLGVGLGDWQTHYPVYRAVGRNVAFDDRFQVRRAHSDHVQFLGEGGLPGALLWAGFVLSLGLAAHRRAWRLRDTESMALAAQGVALFAAMGSDYLLELPYNKFQFFLFLMLFWSAPGKGDEGARSFGAEAPEWNPPTWLRGAVTAAVLIAMVSSLFHYGQLLRRVQATASIAQPYGQWASGEAAAWPRVLRQVHLDGTTVQDGGGETKTLHKDFVMLAHIALAAGQRTQAEQYGRRALDYHPHFTSAFRLLAEASRDPAAKIRWRGHYDTVMHQTTDGWPETTALPSR